MKLFDSLLKQTLENLLKEKNLLYLSWYENFYRSYSCSSQRKRRSFYYWQ